MKLYVLALAVSLITASFADEALVPHEPCVMLKTDCGTVVCEIEEYVARVVAHEVPYTFEEEALKAQAVAARTYLYYCLDNNSRSHENADVCTDASHCCGYITEEELDKRYGDGYGAAAFERIRAAVRATDGEVMTYGGKPLAALWHASSDGFTEDCSAVFLQSLPYLCSVETPEETAAYTVSFTLDEAKKRLNAFGFTVNAVGIPHQTRTASGRCRSLTLGGITLSGNTARSVFGLRSTDFILMRHGERLYFTISSYGHGVGMSQNGANVLAKNGASYREILAHYYSGCDFWNTKN